MSRGEIIAELLACFDVGFEGSPVEEERGASVEERGAEHRSVSIEGRLFEVRVREIGDDG